MTFSLLFLFVFFAAYFVWFVTSLKQVQTDAFANHTAYVANAFKT